MKFRKILMLSSLIIFFTFQSCLNLRQCNEVFAHRYLCKNNSNAINYLDINADGTFLHIYEEGDVKLKNSGTWEKNEDGYCYIELSDWKTFNEKGLNYEDYNNGILYINGDYLDMSPDGNSSTSFIKDQSSLTK
ncbi:MAG: hypothetical protein CL530_03380 [Aequorivita sp.]|nr:hypothetical protein [Aequorivita sp.]|tara:strand:+ start:7086 stop:7487 length:402 start_codon:yes stop_codon:yes gene_type:complete